MISLCLNPHPGHLSKQIPTILALCSHLQRVPGGERHLLLQLPDSLCVRSSSTNLGMLSWPGLAGPEAWGPAHPVFTPLSISHVLSSFQLRLLLFSGEVLLLSPDSLGLSLVLLGTSHASQVPKALPIPSVTHSRLCHLWFGNQLALSLLIEKR